MRAFVFKSATSSKAIAVLDCVSLAADKAMVPGHVKLSSLRPGMIVRPAIEGKPDMTIAYTIKSVGQGTKGSNSNILFQGGSRASAKAAAKTPAREEDKSK